MFLLFHLSYLLLLWRLQAIAERLVEHFVSAGLMVREWDRVKLHGTVMNTLFRKDSTGTFIAHPSDELSTSAAAVVLWELSPSSCFPAPLSLSLSLAVVWAIATTEFLNVGMRQLVLGSFASVQRAPCFPRTATMSSFTGAVDKVQPQFPNLSAAEQQGPTNDGPFGHWQCLSAT